MPNECPGCQSTEIYQGLNDLECPTKGCPHFSWKQFQTVNEGKEDPSDENWDDENTNPNYNPMDYMDYLVDLDDDVTLKIYLF